MRIQENEWKVITNIDKTKSKKDKIEYGIIDYLV